MIDHDNDEPAIDDPTVPDEPALTTAGGWCGPSELLYPDVAVRRGGIQFTAPKPLTKKQLQRQVDDLRAANTRQRDKISRLERKNRRLRRAIKRLIG